MRPYRLAAIAVAALATVAPLPARAAARPADSCWHVAVSPAYATDGKVACAGWSGRVVLSTDRGRTWQERPSTGLVQEQVQSLAFSPRYAADHTLYAFGMHAYASTDDGATFVPVDPEWAWYGRMVPFLSTLGDAVPEPLRDRVSFAYPNIDPYVGRSLPQVVDPGLHARRQVTGSTRGLTLDFAVPPRLDANGVAFAFTLRDSGWVIDRCDATFTCATEAAAFEDDDYYLSLPRFWVSPDWPHHRDVLAVTHADHGAVALRSVDGGATFTRWRSVERLTNKNYRDDFGGPDTSFAYHASLPNRLYLVVHQDLKANARKGALASTLYRSDDRGATWRRVATRHVGDGASPRRGRLPGEVDTVTLAPDGRLFATTDIGDDASGVHCSVDGGSTWRRSC